VQFGVCLIVEKRIPVLYDLLLNAGMLQNKEEANIFLSRVSLLVL
jgi:hypothetical protein